MGRYVVEERIGAGGMAEVFRARLVGAEGFSRPVALKRIAAHLSSDPQFAELFIAEARLAALLGHANVVSVLDFDRDDDGMLFLAMELVDGTDLRRLARAAGGPLPVGLALFIAAETLRGLSHAHDLQKDGKPLGLVHRDVSPHNILISRGGGVKVADFGIAKASAASTSGSAQGVIKGKLPYMAPEQAAGDAVSAQTDLWAVGIVLHELLVGTRPFDGATDTETLARVLRAELPALPATVPPDVAMVLRALLSRAPAERPAGADSAALALRACAAYPPNGEKELAALVARLTPTIQEATDRDAVAARPPRTASTSAQPTPTPPPPSRRWLYALGALAAASVTAAIYVATHTPTTSAPLASAPVPMPAPTPARAPAKASAAVPTVPVTPPDAAPAAPQPSASTPPPLRTEAGRLTVRAKSTWADIRVDGVSWGTTPQTRDVAPGPHKVTLSNGDQGKRTTRNVTVDPGRTRTVEADW